MSQGSRAQPGHSSSVQATESSVRPARMYSRDFFGDLLEDGPHQTTRYKENVTRTGVTTKYNTLSVKV